MPFLMTILGIIVTVSVVWWRAKMVRNAASDALDAAGRLKGAYTRRKFRKAAALSPLATIDDPVVAAATLIAAINGEDMLLGDQEKEIIVMALKNIVPQEKAEEAAIYGAWAAAHVETAATVINQLAPLLRNQLNGAEKEDLLRLIETARQGMVALLPDPIDDDDFMRLMKKLRQKLGLEV